MAKVTLFTGLTSSAAEVEKRFAAHKAEAQRLAGEIDVLEDRLSDAETISAVVGSEDSSRLTAYRRALAEGRTADAKAIGDEINKIRNTAFEKTNAVEGLKALLDEKRQALASLQKKLQERDYLLALSELYPLYDKFNQQSAELAATIRGMLSSFYKTEKAAKASGISFPHHIRPEYNKGFPLELPKIFAERDANGNSGALPNEKDFWYYEREISSLR